MTTVIRHLNVPCARDIVGLFAFLLSWGNFPLSLFTTGADSTLPEWLFAKMVSGYSPLVPTVGMLTVLTSAVLVLGALLLAWAIRRLRPTD